MNSHTVSEILRKDSRQFAPEDILDLVRERGIRMVNFMYPAGDGRLKTLNFVINNEDYLMSLLCRGERVDGSSLFPFVQAGSSDLYVLPRLSTAFFDPFAELPTLCFLCAYFDKDGNRLESSPEYILQKAAADFKARTGLCFEAMGELEYYVSAPEEGPLAMYPATDQRGYHESAPFSKFGDFRTKCMYYMMLAGVSVKYGHSEVGNFRKDGRVWEQNEIELLPVPMEKAADDLMLAKWIIRNLAYREGLKVSFAPKIMEGKAGSGLHIHMRMSDAEGRNVLTDEAGNISDTARRAIAGLMELAPSITAFGNANPTSYLRLVPHQEAPTAVCWGDRNRSVLVRIPLGWAVGRDMFAALNGRPSPLKYDNSKQTMEIRSADASADVYLLLSALSVACVHGLSRPDALEIAGRTYVDVDIHKDGNAEARNLEHLPDSCSASADMLEGQRQVYERDGIFPREVTDGIIARLRSFGDADLRGRLKADPSLEASLTAEFFDC